MQRNKTNEERQRGMSKMMLSELCNTIQPLDEQAMQTAQKKWNQIAKPLHSLGRLEEMIIQLAGIHGTANLQPRKKAILIFVQIMVL